MKKYILAVALLLTAKTVMYAQDGQSGTSVVLCESYDEFGTASGIYQTWDIAPTGGYVYVIYKQVYAISASKMSLQIAQKSELTQEYITTQTLPMVIEAGKNWAMYDYFFTEAGKYKVTVLIDDKVAASTLTEIFVKEDADGFDSDSTINTFYYEGSVVLFCDSVSNAVMIGESESFALGPNGSVTITIYIAHEDAFRTSLFYIDVFEDVGDDFIDYDSYNITVQPDWDYSFVKQTFTRKGTYVVDVYNAEDIYVNTGEVVIY